METKSIKDSPQKDIKCFQKSPHSGNGHFSDVATNLSISNDECSNVANDLSLYLEDDESEHSTVQHSTVADETSTDCDSFLDNEAEDAGDLYMSHDSMNEEEKGNLKENAFLEKGESIDDDDDDESNHESDEYEYDSFCVSDDDSLSEVGDDIKMNSPNMLNHRLKKSENNFNSDNSLVQEISRKSRSGRKVRKIESSDEEDENSINTGADNCNIKEVCTIPEVLSNETKLSTSLKTNEESEQVNVSKDVMEEADLNTKPLNPLETSEVSVQSNAMKEEVCLESNFKTLNLISITGNPVLTSRSFDHITEICSSVLAKVQKPKYVGPKSKSEKRKRIDFSKESTLGSDELNVIYKEKQSNVVKSSKKIKASKTDLNDCTIAQLKEQNTGLDTNLPSTLPKSKNTLNVSVFTKNNSNDKKCMAKSIKNDTLQMPGSKQTLAIKKNKQFKVAVHKNIKHARPALHGSTSNFIIECLPSKSNNSSCNDLKKKPYLCRMGLFNVKKISNSNDKTIFSIVKSAKEKARSLRK